METHHGLSLGKHSSRTSARNTRQPPSMGPSTWPETEVSPRHERVLLQAARLRPFGVNYLQGAICPYLGLLAHLDGSSLHLFPFPGGDSRDEPWDACVASIDLSPGTRTSNRNGDGRGPSRGGNETGGCSPAGGVPRCLSWTHCNRHTVVLRPPVGESVAVTSVTAAAVTSAEVTIPPESLRGGGSGSQVKEGAGWDDDARSSSGGAVVGGVGGKVSAHLAVACGSDVRLWEVSRFSGRRGADLGGTWEENESADGRYRYSTAEVLTDWHRTVGGCVRKADCGRNAAGAAAGGIRHEDGIDDEENAANGDGAATLSKGGGLTTGDSNLTTGDSKVRCISFRPDGGEDARKLERGREGEGPLLAVWYDNGAAVLGPGRKRAMFPAPVAKKRACGAWSGCGRYLATSSGGEIRVHINPSGQGTPEAIGDLDTGLVNSSAREPARAVEAWAGSDSTVPQADGVLASEADEGASAPLAQILSASGTGNSEHFGGKSFRTVLCVEAALHDGSGGVLSSPGSSAGGSSPPSPRSTPSRRRASPSGRHGLNDLTPPPSFAHMPSSSPQSDKEHHSNLSSKPVASKTLVGDVSSKPKSLMGDMRAMCPAGPSAFFGTTDGGLGVASLFGRGDGRDGSFTSVSTSSRRGQDLLGAIVSDSVARVAASHTTTDAALSFRDIASPMQTSLGGRGGGEDGEKHSRRGGFRHVLPGENWLSGSLRPRSRSPPIRSLQQGSLFSESFSSTQPSRNAAGEANTMTGEVSKLAEAGNTAAVCALDGDGLLSGAPNPTLACSLPLSASAPEVLDLRGKIGGLRSGAEGGTASLDARSTHPLFRLSLDGEIDPAVSTFAGSRAAPKIGSVNGRGADVRGSTSVSGVSESYGDTADAPRRRPWLMRVSCRSTSTAGSNDSKGTANNAVRVKTLAALPLELVSPDLLASSDDGIFVAVGSHASGLIACYRLSVRLVEGGRRPASGVATAAHERKEHEDTISGVALGGHEHEESRSGVGGVVSADGTTTENSVNAAGGSGVRRRRQKRLAVPLCTLRLPPGYRAKGLAFVKDGGERNASVKLGRHEDTDGVGFAVGDGDLTGREDLEGVGTAVRAVIGDNRVRGSPISTTDCGSRGGGVAVLVLAGCPVADPNSVAHSNQRGTSKSSPLASRSLGNSAVELSYRTVLLRFSLPRIAVGGSGDVKRLPSFAPKGYADEHGYRRDTSGVKSTSSKLNIDEASLVGLGSSDGLSGRGGSSVGDNCDAMNVGVLGREGKREGSGELSSEVDKYCISATRKQKAVAPQYREGSRHGGASGSGGLLPDEFAHLSLSVGGEAGGSSAIVDVDDGGPVAGDVLSVPEDTWPALVGGETGTGRSAVERQRSAPFATAVLEGLAGMEQRMGERLDRIERLMLGVCDRVGVLERSLDDIARDKGGEKRDG